MFDFDLSAKELKQHGIDNAEGELTEILSYFCDIPFEKIRQMLLLSRGQNTDFTDFVDTESEIRIKNALRCRIAGMPVQYLTNRAYFYGREFYVDKNVLIPRFDTECVVEEALKYINSDSRILDLCSGSGCIGLTLSAESGCRVTLADVSENALNVSKINAEKLRIDANFICHNVLSDNIEDSFDLIISNPPYISVEDMRKLSAEVRNEPALALEAGDGYDFYRVMPARYFLNIKDGGHLIFEIGINQHERVCEYCLQAGFSNVYTAKDYNNIIRTVVAVKTEG